MQNKKFNINLIITLIVFVLTCLVYVLFPNLEFKTEKLNRLFGITFNVFCFYVSFLIFQYSKTVKSKFIKHSFTTINSIFLLISLLNFLLYLLKIDPETQYYDIKTLYYNRNNKFEKIEEQYYINWKNNQKNIVANKVYDFWIFRNFIEYHIDTNNLDENWIKLPNRSTN